MERLLGGALAVGALFGLLAYLSSRQDGSGADELAAPVLGSNEQFVSTVGVAIG